MSRASNLLIVGLLVSGAAARAEPMPKVQPQPSSMSPERAMQMNGLSPVLPSTQVLTFEDAVAAALKRNPSATVAMEEVTRIRAVVEEVRAASLPTLSINATYTRLEQTRVLAGSVIAPADQINANLFLAAPLVAPARWVQWSHAKDNVDVARMNAEDVRRQVAQATARTYLQILAQHHVVEVSERARDSARAHYDYAHRRFVGGYGTRVDEVRAAQEVAADETQLQSAVANLARLREALGVLAGVDHALDVTDEVQLPGAPTLEQSLKDAQSIRSDVQLFRGRLHAAQHVAHDDWADYAPTLFLTLQPFFQDPPTAQLPQWGFQGQLVLSWTIYDGGLRYGLQKERASLVREAQQEVEGGVRQAQADVRAAAEEIRRSAAALAAARDAAKLAAEGLSLTNLAYRGGASTNIEVIDAERRARDADTSVAQAEDAWLQSTLDLLLASGRFPAR